MPDHPTRMNKLVEYIRENPAGQSYPDHRLDYYTRFLMIDDYLNRDVHPTVNIGAAANDEQRSVFLTDHGPEHIATVLRRIGDLLSTNLSILQPYEAYLLAVATHLHDTGNVFGRRGHERRIVNVMNQLGDGLLGTDGIERRMIKDIATAHGGYVSQDERNKDTIGSLSYDDSERGVRVKLLAALLRFGDELADDYTRTSVYLLNTGAISPESEVYHHYADRLREVSVASAEKTVRLRFDIAKSLLCRKMSKGGEQVYLIDEIKDRCMKMHREQVYCSRFMLPHVDISRIDVRIVVCDRLADDAMSNEYSDVVKKWDFSLQQSGYPGHLTSLKEISPEFDGLNGDSLSTAFSN